ncbi:MAG: hypothetical protein SH868_07430 [Bythopirellula sp.]|nr:hypothetical protein [Bythopirellula sp.]
MTDDPLKIDTSTSRQPPAKKRRGYGCWLLAFAALSLLASVFALFPGSAKQQLAQDPQKKQLINLQDENTFQDVLADESQLQWISPTAGPPITLEYVPLGRQVILHLRPTELLANDEGEKVLAALGPWGAGMVGQIEQLSGMKLGEIEALLIALHRDNDAWLCTLRITLVTPWTQQKLKQRIDATTNQNHVLFSPQTGQGSVLVSCPQSMLAELHERGSEPAILARDLERLLARTDADRSVTLLMPAKFLDTEGRELFLDGGEKLLAAFHALVPANASAVAMSLDWRENFFCELQATIVQNAPAHRFAAKLAEQLQSAGQQMAAVLASQPPHPYGQAIEARFPAMLQILSQQTRTSHDKGIALARCYLPPPAGHNLMLASRLRLSGDSSPLTKATALSISDQLNKVTTLSFPKETLEKALEMLAADLEISIRIAGRDLQLEGITKNQTLSLDLRDRPASEILVEVLRRANPDREATSAADPQQKLVYVIRDDAIIVTTRKAATERGEELPEVFRVPEQ